MPGTVFRTLELSQLKLAKDCREGTAIIPILEMVKLRFREVPSEIMIQSQAQLALLASSNHWKTLSLG
jgi:hypothetical protein